MKRTNFVDGIELNSDDFLYGDNAHIEDINVRTRHIAQVGVRNGLTVSPSGSSPSTAIVVAPGDGYCGDPSLVGQDGTAYGEHLVYSGGTFQLSGAVNNGNSQNIVAGNTYYVNLVYGEQLNIPKPLEDNVSIGFSQVNVIVSLEVVQDAYYNNVSNYPNGDADRQKRLRVGILTPSISGQISSGEITLAEQVGSVLYATQPKNIIGVTIMQVSNNTLLGQGSLQLGVLATQYQLQWQAPLDSVYGAYVTLVGNGNVILYGQSVTTWIKVYVEVASLPAQSLFYPNPGTLVDSITVYDLYHAPITIFSGADVLHRSMIGTGEVSEINPHGLSLADLGSSIQTDLTGHRKIEHGNGIQSSNSSAFTPTVLNNAPADDQISILNMSSGEYAYVQGNEYTGIPATLLSPQTLYQGGSYSTANKYMTEVALRYDGVVIMNPRATWPISSQIPGIGIWDASSSYISGVTGQLSLTVNGGVYKLQWQSGGLVIVNPSVSDSYMLYDQNAQYWVLVSIVSNGLPVASTSMQVSFLSELDWTTNLAICNFIWDDAYGRIYTMVYVGARAINSVYDKRLWGTLPMRALRSDIAFPDGRLRVVGTDGRIFALHVVVDPVSGAFSLVTAVDGTINY